MKPRYARVPVQFIRWLWHPKFHIPYEQRLNWGRTSTNHTDGSINCVKSGIGDVAVQLQSRHWAGAENIGDKTRSESS
jgi:hypothetical protein